MTVYFFDYVNGNNANAGTSFATRKQYPDAVTFGAGDEARFMRSDHPVDTGLTATFTLQSLSVTIPSEIIKEIDDCDSAWTASANVTATVSTTRKEGTGSASLAIAAGFTTGLVAFKALGAATDFSAYEQISFWARPDVAVPANTFEIRLCSDVAGLVAVDTFTINDGLPAAFSAWTINKGSALGASIQSIAVYALVDPGTVTLLLDNFFAVKAVSAVDSISLNSLWGKNNDIAYENLPVSTWHCAKSITASGGVTTLVMDAGRESAQGAGRGFWGSTESVTLWKREPIITANAVRPLGFLLGGSTSTVNASFGWNQTDMSTQDGESFYAARGNATVQGLMLQGSGSISIDGDRLGLFRYAVGTQIDTGSRRITINSLKHCGNSTNNINLTGTYNTIVKNVNTYHSTSASINTGVGGSTGAPYWENCRAFSSTTAGFSTIISYAVGCNGLYAENNGGSGLSSNQGTLRSAKNIVCNSNAAGGISLTSSSGELINVTTKNNTGDGIIISSCNNIKILNLESTGNSSNDVEIAGTTKAYVELGSVPLTTTVNYGSSIQDKWIAWDNFSSSAETFPANHKNFGSGHGYIARRTDTTRRVSSGEALEYNPTNATKWTAENPMLELIGRFYVHANKTATFKPFFARTHSDIVIKAVVYGGIVAGIPSDVSVTSTATPASPVTSSDYQVETLSVTPTEDAWIEVWCHCYNLNGNITAKGYWHGYQELPREA